MSVIAIGFDTPGWEQAPWADHSIVGGWMGGWVSGDGWCDSSVTGWWVVSGGQGLKV